MRVFFITKLAGYSILIIYIMYHQHYLYPNFSGIISVNSGGCSTIAYIGVVVNCYIVSHTFTSTIYDLDNIFMIPLSPPTSQDTPYSLETHSGLRINGILI